MYKVWMRSFVGESLSCSLQGGVHAAWAGTQSFLQEENTSTIQLSQCERGDNTSSTGDNTSSAVRAGVVVAPPRFLNQCEGQSCDALHHRRTSAACVTIGWGSTLRTSS